MQKKLFIFILVLMFWSTHLIEIGYSGDTRIIIEPEIYQNCTNTTHLERFAEWLECDNTTERNYCHTSNWTQTHECLHGCDSVEGVCSPAAYKINLMIIGLVIAIIIILALVLTR